MQKPVIIELGGAPAGAPVVCLHGFTGSPDSWRPHAVALGAGGPVHALALPGHGPSSPVADGFDANVAWIAHQIEDAGLAGCHLIGYSLGARAGLGVAVAHPHIAARLTLIGVNPGLATAAERAARRESDARWTTLLRTKGIEAFTDAWQALPIFATQSGAPARRLAAQRAIRVSHDPEGLARSLEHMGLGAMPDYRAELAAVDVPVRLVTGALDDKFGALAREIAPRLSRATRVVVDGCGHNLLIESEASAWM